MDGREALSRLGGMESSCRRYFSLTNSTASIEGMSDFLRRSIVRRFNQRAKAGTCLYLDATVSRTSDGKTIFIKAVNTSHDEVVSDDD